jgi:hypothetical protein
MVAGGRKMVGARNSNLLGKITVFFVICCLVMGSFVVNTAVALDGSGTQEDPWRIQSLGDFDEFAADANYWAGFTRLETDVNLAGRTYSTAVIAPDTDNSNSGFQGTPFTGVFDGNDHKILNLTIDSGVIYLGLFGYIDTGEVRNLGIEDGYISGDSLIGGLVGWNVAGDISNCYSTGFVSGQSLVGGLVGLNDGGVSNSCSAGNVSGDLTIGGLMGANRGSVSDCYSTADVTGDFGSRNFGGLVGKNLALVSNCYSTGNVSGDMHIGGLMGDNTEDGNVSNCYSIGFVSGDDVGGLVGDNYGGVSNCLWDTQTSGESNMCGNEHSDCDPNYGKTTAEMQTASTFTNYGWDFVGETINGSNDIWRLCEDLVQYPRLSWEFPSGDFICPDGIDFFDYSFFTGHWQDVNCIVSNDCDGTDLDQLGTVDINDIRIFVDNWLRYPPPFQASNPNPADGSLGISNTADLSWTAGLYATSHDVYFGTSSPGIFQGNQTDTIFDPGTMVYSSTYYWRIDEVNGWGKTIGEVWSFTTIYSDLQASNPNPFDGATNVSTTADLNWTAGVDATSHDVYFGTTNPPPFVRNQTDTTFDTGNMANHTSYYWRIDEVNPIGTTTGKVWTFTTYGEPPPPPPPPP